MAGFDNEVVYGSNVDFTGSPTVTPQVTLNGQLLIGADTPPNIRVGNITSNTANLVVTNTPGGISLSDTGIAVIRGPSINFQSTGFTPIFTPSSPFIIIGFILYAVDVDTITMSWSANLGWTAPDYDDYFNSVQGVNNVTGEVDVEIPPPGNPLILIPASVTFGINITTPSTATSDVEKIDILGYYF